MQWVHICPKCLIGERFSHWVWTYKFKRKKWWLQYTEANCLFWLWKHNCRNFHPDDFRFLFESINHLPLCACFLSTPASTNTALSMEKSYFLDHRLSHARGQKLKNKQNRSPCVSFIAVISWNAIYLLLLLLFTKQEKKEISYKEEKNRILLFWLYLSFNYFLAFITSFFSCENLKFFLIIFVFQLHICFF